MRSRLAEPAEQAARSHTVGYVGHGLAENANQARMRGRATGMTGDVLGDKCVSFGVRGAVVETVPHHRDTLFRCDDAYAAVLTEYRVEIGMDCALLVSQLADVRDERTATGDVGKHPLTVVPETFAGPPHVRPTKYIAASWKSFRRSALP